MQHLEPEAPPRHSTDPTAGELVREAMSEARQLIVLEVSLARDEMRREVVAARSAGIALGVGVVASIVATSLMFVAIALAIFPGPVPALILGLVLMVSAMLAGIAGIKLLPKKPLGGTRRRLETDVESVKERVR